MSDDSLVASSTHTLPNPTVHPRTADQASTNQNLWCLLQGNVALSEEAVVMEEMTLAKPRILSALTYYKTYEGDRTPVNFPVVQSIYKSVVTGQLESLIPGADSPSTSTAEPRQKKKPDSHKSSLQLICKAVAQNLNLAFEVANTLVVTYMMYEYKGPTLSYEEIADSQISFKKFYANLQVFYRNERLCLLQCIQSILIGFGDESHQFYRFFERFRNNLSYKSWCWSLALSLSVADERETVEVLHCLSLLLFRFPNESIPPFLTYLLKNGFYNMRASNETKMAEAVTMYSALVVSGLTDCSKSMYPKSFQNVITEFLLAKFDFLVLNPYNLLPIFASYAIFCADDSRMKEKVQSLTLPTRTFQSLMELVNYYDKNSLRDRNSISYMLAAGIFEALEVVLSGFDIKHFGSVQEAAYSLSKILKHSAITENFLCSTPKALTALYVDATSLFPIDIETTLEIWKSMCISAKSEEACTIITGVSKINTLAEYILEGNVGYLRRMDTDKKVSNNQARKLYGVNLEEKTIGNGAKFDGSECIIWELPPSSDVSAFDVLKWNVQPIVHRISQLRDGRTKYDTESQHYYDCARKDLHVISQFIIQFWNSTSRQINELTNLVYPICTILETLLRKTEAHGLVVELMQDLFGIVAAVNKVTHGEVTMVNYVYGILPTSDTVSIVEKEIINRESIMVTDFGITSAFLDLLGSYTAEKKCWCQPRSTGFSVILRQCFGFICKEIVPTIDTWRTNNEGKRLKAYLQLFKVFNDLFALKEDGDWRRMKYACCNHLMRHNSFLHTIFHTDERLLEDAIVIPNEQTRLLPEVVAGGMKLLLNVLRFREEEENEYAEDMCEVNAHHLTIIRTMSRFVRHRFQPAIPTTTMMLLSQISRTNYLTFMSSFGKEEEAFRDLLVQRLQLAAEDISLRVAILDFFTVVIQKQKGIIKSFFNEGVLEKAIIEVLQEEHNEDLAVGCLEFYRAFFATGLLIPPIIEENFWRNILLPINVINPSDCRVGIIGTTFNIITFEFYPKKPTIDYKLSEQLKTLFKPDKFATIVETLVTRKADAALVKSVAAVKHFFTASVYHPEIGKIIPKPTLLILQKLCLERLWMADPKSELELCSNLAELTAIVTEKVSVTAEFLSWVISKLSYHLSDHSLNVQYALLCLLYKCYQKAGLKIISSSDVEITFRMLKKILDVSVKRMRENNLPEEIHTALVVIGNIITLIISKQPIDSWSTPLNTELMTYVMVHVCGLCIEQKSSALVAANFTEALLELSIRPFGCHLMSPSLLSKGLFSHLHKIAQDEDEDWRNVFYICVALKTIMLTGLNHDFLDEAIAFWGQHSNVLLNQLQLMTQLAEISVGLDGPDKAYRLMKGTIQNTILVLNDIWHLLEYIVQWQSAQPTIVFKAIMNVFYILQEICGLVQQPYLIHTTLLPKVKAGSPEARSSPRVVEIQARLWDIAGHCAQILAKVENIEEFVEGLIVMPTIFQLGQLTIKAITKAERRSPHGERLLLHPIHKKVEILEKILVILHHCVMPVFENPQPDVKFLQTFKRDMFTDVVSLCDGIRRLPSARNDFIIDLCTRLDTKFR